MRWGILGPGAIARTFAAAVDALDGHRVTAAGSRDPRRARAFNEERGDPAATAGTYRQLVSNPDVDAVYVATPHPGHLEHAALALRHGKAVLCEKPLCVNASEARRLCGIAQRERRLLLEAMWTRFLPATRQVARWLDAGAIGEPRRLRCAFGFEAGFDPASRLFSPALAGGSLLDVGCYTLSLASLVFGDAITGREPPEMDVDAELAPSGVDQHCRVTLRFANGAVAELESAVSRSLDQTAIIEGAGGRIEIPNFWRAESATLVRSGEADKAEVAERPFGANGYEYQALEVARLLAEGSTESPLLPHAESIALLERMDDARRRIGVQYPFEAAVGRTVGTHRGMAYRRFGPLAEGGERRGSSARPSITRAPLPTDVDDETAAGAFDLSRVLLGTMALHGDTAGGQNHADELLDAAFEHGICGVDTGHVYGSGASERAIGSWLGRQGLENEMFVLSKGCHPDADGPRVTPEALARDLLDSLERLQRERVDLYLLHRDDPTVPVGELVDAFDEHLRQGRLGGYGFSNWRRQRIEEAWNYAAANDRPLPAASSPHFSLADQVRDPWGGCATLTGAGPSAAADRAWHRRTGLPIFAWSSLARGLFSGRVTRRALAADSELVDPACRTAYVHEANLKRLERVIEFAEATKATVPQVALAWVLAQDLPLYAIVGADCEREIEETVAATALALTADEQRWLRDGGRRPESMARESLSARLEKLGVRVGRRLPGPIKRPLKQLFGRP